jgi:putative membrane-bound dehydrogenase-like protein
MRFTIAFPRWPARSFLCLVAFTIAFRDAHAEPKLPELKEAGLKIELIAAEPDLATPIGCVVDRKGRVYVLESHTHFPPKGYDGPKTDIIKVWSDGRPGKPSIFADGFVKAMNLAFAPDGSLYVTQRDAVFRLRDDDADGVAETKETILKLHSNGDYPHNGLDGIAFGPDGMLYVGMGENLGAPYTLHGSDGSQEQGGGEGGNIFRSTPDGKRLERWATGFWNPFALTFTAAGHLFMVDNDPDSRPPCRLNHVIRGGDYGYKFRYGRKGTHPFIAWNGELPGTLPMVAGTGEAPSGLMEASKARLTPAFDGSLIVAGTWEHTLERYRLEPRGASWQAKREIFAAGDGDFRPVALAPAPDGSVYITDWVKSDYSVHKHGRLWRLSAEKPVAVNPVVETSEQKRLVTLEALPVGTPLNGEMLAALNSDDPFLQTAAAGCLSREGSITAIEQLCGSDEWRTRLAGLMALRRLKSPTPDKVIVLLRNALTDPYESIRLFAAKWAGEEVIGVLYSDLLSLKERRQSDTLGQVVYSALDALAGKPDLGPLENRPEKNEFTTFPLDAPQRKRRENARREVRGEIGKQDETSLVNAICELIGSDDAADALLLLPFAVDPGRSFAIRSSAIAALQALPIELAKDLLPLLEEPDARLRREAVRTLRNSTSLPAVKSALEKALTKARTDKAAILIEQIEDVLGVSTNAPPKSDEDWRKVLDEAPGDPASGRHLFFQRRVMCANCHMAEGRGAGLVGPDLTTIARTADREKMLQSVLHPSRDVAPQFANMLVTCKSTVRLGRLATRHADQAITLVDPANTGIFIPASEIVSINPSQTSMMPEGLALTMTRSDFRDLVAYLLSLK